LPLRVRERALLLVDTLRENLASIDDEAVDRLAQSILRTLGDRRIFVVGAGRSGLVARAFAMRLMHLGFSVHVVGETTTPRMDPGDLLIVISGSGETLYPATIAGEAKKIGGGIANQLPRLHDREAGRRGRHHKGQNKARGHDGLRVEADHGHPRAPNPPRYPVRALNHDIL